MKASLMAGFALCVAAPALADTPPLFRPSKDVVVEYRIQGAAPGGQNPGDHAVTMYFTDHGNKMRFDAGAGRGYVIVDQQAHKSMIVMTEQHMYMEHATDESRSPMMAMKDATFTRKGTATIAGLSCTVYEVVHDGDKGEACLTDDGLLLQSRSNAGGSPHAMQAVKVTYAPQPAALFAPPEGFQKLDLGAMRGGMGPGGMGPGGMGPGGMGQGGMGQGGGMPPGRTPPGMGMPPSVTQPAR